MKILNYIFPAIIATSVHADELTLKTKSFSVTHSFSATALPGKVIPVRLEPEAWDTFQIASIVAHGSSVKKGELLVSFETEAIDKILTDTRHGIATGELELAKAELELSTLEQTIPEQLARQKLSAKIAAEELTYFTETQRKASEETADQLLKYHEQILASKKEELKQLLQMYKADDITEDTEEIILQNQRDAVEQAEHSLRMEQLSHKRKIAVELPREEVSLSQNRDDTALQLATALKELPRSLELKKLEISGRKTTLQRQREALADLEADRKLFEIKAAEDGLFYHGSIEDGNWITGDLVKSLIPNGAAPIKKNFATLIPSTANIVIKALPQQADASSLTTETKGFAILTGMEDMLIPVTLSDLSKIPNPDSTYSATLSADWPKGLKVIPGQTMGIKMISYSSEKALNVPTEALELSAKGWTIEVKLADGKTERRTVTRGKTSGEQTEITDGLEAGQVVIVP